MASKSIPCLSNTLQSLFQVRTKQTIASFYLNHLTRPRKFSTTSSKKMRIATLQFAPKLGDVEGNVRRANEILARGKVLSSGLEALVNSKLGIDTTTSIERLKPDVLVLPEMALSGMYPSTRYM